MSRARMKGEDEEKDMEDAERRRDEDDESMGTRRSGRTRKRKSYQDAEAASSSRSKKSRGQLNTLQRERNQLLSKHVLSCKKVSGRHFEAACTPKFSPLTHSHQNAKPKRKTHDSSLRTQEDLSAKRPTRP